MLYSCTGMATVGVKGLDEMDDFIFNFHVTTSATPRTRIEVNPE